MRDNFPLSLADQICSSLSRFPKTTIDFSFNFSEQVIPKSATGLEFGLLDVSIFGSDAKISTESVEHSSSDGESILCVGDSHCGF